MHVSLCTSVYVWATHANRDSFWHTAVVLCLCAGQCAEARQLQQQLEALSATGMTVTAHINHASHEEHQLQEKVGAVCMAVACLTATHAAATKRLFGSCKPSLPMRTSRCVTQAVRAVPLLHVAYLGLHDKALKCCRASSA